MIDKIASFCGGLKNKTILDVGCDLEGKLVQQLASIRAKEVIGLNLAVQDRELSPNARLESGDIRHTSYADDYFDNIVSVSAFEHIHDLETAIQEMHRILKPGGTLYAIFGPIWSGICGHHLWFEHRSKLYNYWNVILPPFCHLLMNSSALLRFCQNYYPQDLSSQIVQYVDGCPDQNRLFYEDYEHLIRSSKFKVLLFKGYDNPEMNKLYFPLISQDTLNILYLRYPNHSNCFYNGIEMVLKK